MKPKIGSGKGKSGGATKDTLLLNERFVYTPNLGAGYEQIASIYAPGGVIQAARGSNPDSICNLSEMKLHLVMWSTVHIRFTALLIRGSAAFPATNTPTSQLQATNPGTLLDTLVRTWAGSSNFEIMKKWKMSTKLANDSAYRVFKELDLAPHLKDIFKVQNGLTVSAKPYCMLAIVIQPTLVTAAPIAVGVAGFGETKYSLDDPRKASHL